MPGETCSQDVDLKSNEAYGIHGETPDTPTDYYTFMRSCLESKVTNEYRGASL